MVSLRVSLLEGARGDESVVRSARWCNEMRPTTDIPIPDSNG